MLAVLEVTLARAGKGKARQGSSRQDANRSTSR